MRNLKFIECLKLSILLSILVIVSTSCKKDDEDSSSYKGKWRTERAIPYIYGYARVDYYLTISENKYNESFFILPWSMYDNWRFVSIDGSLSVSGNQMQFKPEKISYFHCNSEKEKIDPPYNIVPYDYQDDKCHLSGLFCPISSYKAEFTFDGKVLTLQIDYDEDGDYSEYVETLVYTR